MVSMVGAAPAAAVAGTTHAGARTAASVARAVVVVAQVGLGVALVDHQVDGHLSLQAADVALTEVVAQFVNLPGDTC